MSVPSTVTLERFYERMGVKSVRDAYQAFAEYQHFVEGFALQAVSS
jgi:hypothetical protein